MCTWVNRQVATVVGESINNNMLYFIPFLFSLFLSLSSMFKKDVTAMMIMMTVSEIGATVIILQLSVFVFIFRSLLVVVSRTSAPALCD